MSTLAPLEALYDVTEGRDLPLPGDLRAIYGPLVMPEWSGKPYILANFVSSIDGVVALSTGGQTGGGEISGFNPHDRMIMGLLRALADTVIVGAGTVRSVPKHLWTAEHVYPPLADSYRTLRAALGKSGPPLHVFVTARGGLDFGWRVFNTPEIRVLIVTTGEGEESLRRQTVPPSVQFEVVPEEAHGVQAGAVLEALRRVHPSQTILVEGGPHLMGDFLGERRIDELFLTVAPQVAGRDKSVERPGLAAGRLLAPADPLWARLTGIRRGDSHLFLRYRFDAG